MKAPDTETQITELRRLMAERLEIRGPTLARQVARAGRLVPRRLRAPARMLAAAEPMLSNPRLARRLDPAEAARAHAALRDWLLTLDPREARKTRRIRFAAGLGFNVLLIGAGVVVWLVATGRA